MSFLSRLFGRASEPPTPAGDPLRVAEVEATLAGLRPLLALDGGDVELRAVHESGDVELRFRGACETCSISDQTIQGALEPRLREAHPWMRELLVGA